MLRRIIYRGVLPALVVVGLGAVVQAEDGATSVTIKSEDCRRLVAHHPSADVAYKPGVDVNGNEVAPADLPGQAQIKVPDTISFDVTYDLLDNYGVGEDSALTPRGESSVGTVTYDLLSGQLTFNGQRLGDPEQAALAAACSAAK